MNDMNRAGNVNDAENARNRADLMRKIQALSFVKTECALFLDTHPDSASALRHFREVGEELKRLTDIYEGEFGPLTADGVAGNTWSWVDTPWPWQEAENGRPDCRGIRQ